MLGGEKLWIVADKGREWPGYPLKTLPLRSIVATSFVEEAVKALDR